MAGILRGWHPDPFGVHEMRYFTFDGNATRLVRDGDARTHDAPPAAPVSMMRWRVASPVVGSHSVASELCLRSVQSAQAIFPDAPPILTRREPTQLVRDREVEFYDEPPNDHAGLYNLHLAPPFAAPPISGVGEAPEQLVDPVATFSPPRTTFARLLRYGSVSVFSTVAGLTMLGVMVGVLGWNATWSNVLTTLIMVVPAFELNRRWVWAYSGKRSFLRQAVPYAAMSFAGLVASTIAVHVAAAATSTSTRLVHTAAVELANVGAYGALWIVQFVVCDRLLFRSRSKAAEADDSNGPFGSNGLSGHDTVGRDVDGLPLASQVVA
jgi:putative flippase GtrA